MILLAGCADPSSARGPCATYHEPGDELVVQFEAPAQRTYSEWTIPPWSAYDVDVVRYASNGDPLWTRPEVIEQGCLSAPLSGPGEYRVTATASVPEDDYCWYSAWLTFSYEAGLVEKDVGVGVVCA